MKKLFVVLLALCLLLLVGCNGKNGNDEKTENNELQLSLGDGVGEISVTKQGKYEPYAVSGDEFSSFLGSLSEIYYTKGGEMSAADASEYDFNYLISAGESCIMVGSSDFLLQADSGSYIIGEVKRGSFAFLDSLEFRLTPENLSETLGYTSEDLQSISFYDVAKGLTVDLSANASLKELLLSVCYDPNEKTSEADSDPLYVLTFGGKELAVNSDGTVCYNDGDSEIRLAVFDNGLDCLGTILEGDETTLAGYTDVQSVKVYNDRKFVAEITEVADFLDDLGTVKYIKLQNEDNYELSAADYTIHIDGDVIEIRGTYLVIGDSIYVITEGDFDFLKGLTFTSSSGSLPWI